MRTLTFLFSLALFSITAISQHVYSSSASDADNMAAIREWIAPVVNDSV